MVLSKGWNQSRFSIRSRCESAIFGQKKLGEPSSFVSLKSFQTWPSYISAKISSKFWQFFQCRREFSNPGRLYNLINCWRISANEKTNMDFVLISLIAEVCSDNEA